VNDKDLSNLYEEEQARFSTEEERKAQHINSLRSASKGLTSFALILFNLIT
jgi:hypothetical protein